MIWFVVIPRRDIVPRSFGSPMTMENPTRQTDEHEDGLSLSRALKTQVIQGGPSMSADYEPSP